MQDHSRIMKHFAIRNIKEMPVLTNEVNIVSPTVFT